MKLHKLFPTKISDKATMKEAVHDFGLNLCKGINVFKRDKDIVASAVSNDPYAIKFADKEVAQMPEVQNALGSKKEKLQKFYLESMENNIDFTKSELSEEELQLFVLRNNKADERYNKIEEQLNNMSRDDRAF